MPSAFTSYLKSIKPGLLRAAIYLGIIAVLHFALGYRLMPGIRWTIVGIILAAAFVPARYSQLASGLGFLAVAGVSWFVYRNDAIALICGAFGAIVLFTGVRALTQRGGPHDG